jgi:hypothetical protein
VKRLVLVVMIASTVLVAACGTDDPSMTTAAATALQAQVADARTAVANAEYAHARELLDGIDARTVQLAAQGDLSNGRATAVRNAVAEVRAALKSYLATTTTTPTTTTTTTTTAKTKPTPPDRRGPGNDGKPGKGGKDD